jgi:uncharacterized protein DUF4403
MKHPFRTPVVVVVTLVLAVALVVGLFLWRSFSGQVLVDAPAPRMTAEGADTLDRPPASVVEAPVKYDLATAVDSLEVAVPRTFGDLENRIQAGDNARAHFAFTLSRSPFRVRVVGQTVSISADVEYEGRVWYKPVIGPEFRASCGTGGVPRPRVRATLESTGRLTPQWNLRTHTHLTRLEPFSDDPRDKCRLTPLRIDVTDRVIQATKGMMEQKVQQFDSAVATWRVRPRFEALWRQLQRPIRLTDSVYMVFNPFAAQIGQVGAVGDTVVAHLLLIASPRVITGPRPNDFDLMKPMPPLETTRNAGLGAHVLVDASFSYPVATALLRRVLVGKTIRQSGRKVRIHDVELSGVGGGRVALGVTLAGAVRGRLYFIGTPGFDPANHQIYVPDLDYDVGSAQLLVKGFEWLMGVDIRDFLRDRARLPDTEVVGKLADLAQRGLNRTLAPGIELSGKIHDAKGTTVHATTQAIRVRAVADAEIELAINKAPALPRPVQSKGTRTKAGG